MRSDTERSRSKNWVAAINGFGMHGARLLQASPLVQGALLRSVALALIGGVVLCFWGVPEVPGQLLAGLAIGCVANLVLARVASVGWGVRSLRWSALIANLVGWGSLVAWTGGGRSPFVVTLWFELALASAVFSSFDLLVVGALALVTLWGQECVAVLRLPAGLRPSHFTEALQAAGFPSTELWIQSVLTAIFGAFCGGMARYWSLQQRRLVGEATALSARTASLEVQLEEAQRLSQLGQQSARQAHYFKSLLASLRGFLMLVDPEQLEQLGQGGRDELSGSGKPMQGAWQALDRMEQAVYQKLHPGGLVVDEQLRTSHAELQAILDEVARELAAVYHEVRWVRRGSTVVPDVAFPASALREVALVLSENAAEASGAGGTVVVQVDALQDVVRLIIEDDGPGLGALTHEDLFQWGVTTKAHGNGAGLFLSKQLVESLGGALSAAPRSQGGMAFSVTLPLCRA